MKPLRSLSLSCLVFCSLWSMSIGFAEDTAKVEVAPVVKTDVASEIKTEVKTEIKTEVQTSTTKGKDAVCLKCHEEKPVVYLFKTKHGVTGDTRAPSCQSCHGQSDDHLKNKKTSPDVIFKKGTFAVSEVKAQNANCLACHDKDAKRTNWSGSAHQVNDVACISCHTVHAEHDKVRERTTQAETCFTCHKEQRTDSHKISHHPLAEGKVTCADCHNMHGSSGPKMLKKDTVNQTCFTCHAEKRGPFLWEHLPVTENCNNCHNPHGSNVAPLLKTRAPFLCQSCHDGPHNSATPRGPNTGGTQGGLKTTLPSENNVGRACMNCHVMVHGSNHPAGALLHR